MSELKFLNEAQTDVMADACRPGVKTPVGSYAREVAGVMTMGRIDPADVDTMALLGVVSVTPGVYDPTTEEVTARDFDRDAGGHVVIVNQAVTEVLTTQSIDAQTLADAEAARLTAAQASAVASIDAQAEAKRLGIITAGSGQAMSYQVKAEEANDCLANYDAANPPATGTYLLLDSEVGIMANADETFTADAYEVAVVVDATRQAWLQAEAAINRVRVQAKADIKVAATPADVDAVLAAIVWP